MNGLMHRTVLIMVLVFGSAGSLAAKDWRGILPLHSTREDVERLLGPPQNPGWIYVLEDGEVRIVFPAGSARPMCPAKIVDGTVLMIEVTPKPGLLVRDLDLQRGFRKFNPTQWKETEYEGFINEEDGLVIRANKGTVDLMVYFASSTDMPRCPDYYGYDHESFVAVPMTCGRLNKFDEYGEQPFEDEKARLDNFAIQILNTPELNGHVIVYAGRKATVAQAQIHANRIKNYLLSVREIDPTRLTVVDGGHREEFAVQLYVIPAGVPPPEPDPTVKAQDVELVYEKSKRGKKNR